MCFEKRFSSIDEVITNVAFVSVCILSRCFTCEVDGSFGNIDFRRVGTLAYLFNYMAVAIPAGELHPGVRTRRILSQNRLDQTDPFKEVTPVERGQQSHAGNDVPYRYLGGGLALML